MREVIEGVSIIERTWGSNIYIIPAGEGTPVTTLIDAGFSMDFGRIATALDNGCRCGELLVVATHCHFDHVGSLERLKGRYEVRLAAHALDADIIEGTTPYLLFKVDRVRTVYYKALSPFLFTYHFVDVETRLAEGDVVEALGGLRVVHVPGHTPGSIALFQADRGLLFSGDTIRNESGVVDGPPPQFSPGIEESYWGIREKLLPLDFDVLLPGHGEPVTGSAGRSVRRMMTGCGRLG